MALRAQCYQNILRDLPCRASALRHGKVEICGPLQGPDLIVALYMKHDSLDSRAIVAGAEAGFLYKYRLAAPW